VSETAIRTAGLGLTIAYAGLLGWLFASQPASLAEATGGLAAGVGAYRVDPQAFDDGLRYFRNDQFVEARAALARADPARRDALTQFYIAYSYYREGWSRMRHDDTAYAEGLKALDRAIAVAPEGRIVVDDPRLQMHSADELRAELVAGQTTDASDFNPLRLFRGRK